MRLSPSPIHESPARWTNTGRATASLRYTSINDVLDEGLHAWLTDLILLVPPACASC